MNKTVIAEKIVYHRKVKGLTQEELAERTGLNVRTVQRIEAGEVDPRLHTLKTIADALEVNLEEFNSPPNEDDKSSLALVHGSALLALLFPLGNILGPIIIWVLKKSNSKHITSHAKEVLNTQITYSAITYIPSLVFVYFLINKDKYLISLGVSNTIYLFVVIMMLLPMLFFLVFPLIYTRKVYKTGKLPKYPLRFKLFK